VSEIKVLYTAEATAVGGRSGHARSSDGRLDVALSVPEEMHGDGGPGTNPEQLFAAGYAACFESAMASVAHGVLNRNLDLEGSHLTARVGIGPTGHGGFGLTVSLDFHAPHLAAEDALMLMTRATWRCPYSNATRGNVTTNLSVDGRPLRSLTAA
jgi:lipoyl-dependent peroxiredoxin